MTSPRILFITPAAFNRVNGTGITFSNLFKGWPKDDIATVHNDPVPVSDDICDRYYRLGGNEISLAPPLNRLHQKKTEAGPNGASTTVKPRKSMLHRIKDLIFGDGLPERGTLTPELERWIADYQPTVIYTLLGSNGMLDLIKAIRDRFNLPVIVHFMDDWQSAIYRGGLLSWIQRRKMYRLTDDLVRNAALRLGICDRMCDVYARRFGLPFQAFQNAIDVQKWLRPRQTNIVSSSKHVVYTGSILSFAQLESLAACCRVLVELRKGGMDLRLDIYSPNYQSAGIKECLVIDPAIKLHDTIIDDSQYFDTLRQADVLLLPANFDAHSMTYVGLSMPTKVPSYLTSGTPILVYGPARLAQVDYAAREGWGLVIDQPDIEALKLGLKRIIEDTALRRSLSQRAQQLAKERHDADTVRAAFQAALRKDYSQ